MAKRREYSQEFKQKAVQLAKSADHSISQVALKLGISNGVLGRWIRENPGSGAGALAKQNKNSNEEVIKEKREIEQILLIDDDEDYRNLTVRRLSRSFPNVSIKEIDPVNNELPDKHFCWDNIDLIILDYDFGLDYTGLDWVKIFNTKELPATILMTAQGNEEVATKAIKIGIDDYIVKEHFHEKELMELIKKCVLNKKNRKTIISDIKNKSIVFDKSNFIHKLQLITNEKDTTNNLLLISPEAYQQIGAKKGIRHQDSYMRYVTDWIYAYMTLNNITSNIFVYREEYIAVIIETYRCEKHVKAICEQLNKEKYAIGTEKYPCSINIGVISPQHFEENEFNRTDYELLSIALILCNAAKSDEENQVCNYGDIDVEDAEIIDGDHDNTKISIDFDIKRAVADGRVSANYQPWVYVLSDDKVDVKNIYDVRVEFIDIKGNKIPQQDLFKILDNAFAKRIVDKWVLKNSAYQLMELANNKDKQVDIKLAIKITLSTFADPVFIPWLRNLIAETKLPKGCLLFEIEAEQFIRDTEQCKKIIKKLRSEFDIKFVLTNISNVYVYRKIREPQIFDYIKLNIKNMIFGAPRDPLVELIKEIKKNGAEIIAINVADAESLTFVTEFEVDYIHGYLVGKPYNDVISDSDGDLICVI